jgi:hypothetical protein
MTTLHLTPEMLAGIYDLLRATNPSRRWGLPEKHAVRFRTYRSKAERGTLERDGKDVILSVSELSNAHLHSVFETVAHEMVHLRLLRLGVKLWDRHGARFEHLAKAVCAAHGFDPKAF